MGFSDNKPILSVDSAVEPIVEEGATLDSYCCFHFNRNLEM